MKLFRIEFIEEVKSSVLIQAKNKKDAVEIVNSGDFRSNLDGRYCQDCL